MLAYNEITPKRFIVLSGEPYEVLSSNVFRKQQGKPINQTKLRALKSGKVIERTFHHSENVEEADIKQRTAIFVYARRGEAVFHSPGYPGERFGVPEEIVGDKLKFLTEKTEVTALLFEDEIIGIEIPIKLVLAVAEAPPAVKGNTAQGGTKQIVLETGATVNAPLFINAGDMVCINTETEEYVERASKST